MIRPETASQIDVRTDGRSTVAILQACQVHLWICAVVFFGVGDIATTIVGFQIGYVVEIGPVVGPLIEHYGLGIIGGLKVGVFGICYCMYRFVSAPHNVGVPLGLATFGVLITGWNLLVLIHALQ
jgi:hypothetical protein